VFCALHAVADQKRTSNRDRDPLIALKNDWPKNDLALFAGLTPALRRSERRRIARRASLCAAIILVVAAIIGRIVLDAMGIRLRSLQIGGGFILFVFGLQMVFGWMNQPSASVEKGRDLAVFPLAVPAIAGPGAIMAIILLTDNDVFSVSERAETAVVLLVVLVLNYILLLLSDAILRIIGDKVQQCSPGSWGSF